MSDVRARQIEAAVIRLIEIDDRRMAVVQAATDDDMDAAVMATMSIMVEYHDVMAELRLLVTAGGAVEALA